MGHEVEDADLAVSGPEEDSVTRLNLSESDGTTRRRSFELNWGSTYVGLGTRILYQALHKDYALLQVGLQGSSQYLEVFALRGSD